MDKAQQRIKSRKRRMIRVRKKIVGTAERPRLCVRRSLKHVSAQIVDDFAGKTIAQVSTTAKSFSEKSNGGDKPLTQSDRSKLLGEMVAKIAKEQGVNKVVFDRRGYGYHGVVKALAEGARSGGLEF